MGLTSIFRRKPSQKAATPAADSPADLVQQARTRARRRLIGAVVLVVVGVIGFPLLFETKPRPIPVDIPIEIPRKENAPPLAMPAATTRPVRPASPAPAEQAASVASRPDIVTETQADAGRELPPPTKQPASVAPATRPAPAAAKGPVEKPPVAKEGGRFVVQVGAFADSAAARETRQKVEKLGLKTYTQVAETSQGSRIRIRIGPFDSREEADRVMAKLKAAGSPAVVLTL